MLALGVSSFYRILEAKERQENGLGDESSSELVYTSQHTRKPTPCSQSIQEHNLHEQLQMSKLLPYEKKGMNNKSML